MGGQGSRRHASGTRTGARGAPRGAGSRARALAWLGILLLAAAAPQDARAHGDVDDAPPPAGDAALADLDCHEGHAGPYACENVDLLAWLPAGPLAMGRASDLWGWTDPRTGREIVILGLRDGVAFVDASEPTAPRVLATLPAPDVGSLWHDIKVHADHAYVVSEARGHGIQVFDLTRLGAATSPPPALAPDFRYTGLGNAHNLVAIDGADLLVAVGSDTCAGGLHLVDVSRPAEPRFAGCFAEDGYTHDAQCVVYAGPDARYAGRLVCLAANEDSITIVDVTDPAAPRQLSRTGYEGSAYTHQGWLSEDQRYFLVDDELDERRNRTPTRTLVFDVTDLAEPMLVGWHEATVNSIDHNLYVVGDHVFQANYTSGLRVLRHGDLSRPEFAEVAWFDTWPNDDAQRFLGAWSSYPYFPSGVVAVSDIVNGLFLLWPGLAAVPRCDDGLDNDGDGLVDADDPACADPGGQDEAPRHDAALRVWGAAWGTPGRGRLPLAILGSDAMEAASVDLATLVDPVTGAPLAAWQPTLRDVDRDGRLDRVVHLDAAMARAPGAGPCLRWETLDGTAWEACAEAPAPAAPRGGVEP